MDRLARFAYALLLTALAFVAIGEATFRWLRVEPRVVTIRTTRPELDVRELAGRPVWMERESPMMTDVLTEGRRIHLACKDQPGRRVMLLGDSIFFGSGLPPEHGLGPLLEAALQRQDPAWCVTSFAQPGATLHPQLAFFETFLEPLAPEIVVFEIWYGSPSIPTRLGDRIYYAEAFEHDALGYPTFAFGVSGPWHRALFERSRLWNYLTFAVAPQCEGSACIPDFPKMITTQLAPAVATVRARGAAPMIVIATPLDRPLPEIAADPPPWFAPVVTWAAEQQVPLVRLEQLLVDQDVEAIRLDPCCHFNARGMQLVAERLAPHVAALP
jgi:lysophospholipase L1-like esterase